MKAANITTEDGFGLVFKVIIIQGTRTANYLCPGSNLDVFGMKYVYLLYGKGSEASRYLCHPPSTASIHYS